MVADECHTGHPCMSCTYCVWQGCFQYQNIRYIIEVRDLIILPESNLASSFTHIDINQLTLTTNIASLVQEKKL